MFLRESQLQLMHDYLHVYAFNIRLVQQDREA